MTFNENIHSVCLATESSKISSMGIVSGYGMNNENFSIAEKPDTLQAAQLPLWNNQDCQEKYSSLHKNFNISSRQICAGGRNGVDSCYADRFVKFKNEEIFIKKVPFSVLAVVP